MSVIQEKLLYSLQMDNKIIGLFVNLSTKLMISLNWSKKCQNVFFKEKLFFN